jgi:hypothetical protein
VGTIEVTLPKFHDAQRQIAEDSARFKVLMCGRRFGKSMLGWAELCDAAIDGHPVALFAPNYKFASDGWRQIKEMLAPIIKWKSEQEMRLELVNGGSVDVWSLDKPDPGRGRKYKRVFIDEAGIVRNLAECWNAAIRPTLADLKGDAYIVGTPKGAGDFANLFERGQKNDGRWRSWRFKTVDNPYIDSEEIAEARTELPTAVFLQEFEGMPDDEGGNPFGLQAIAECIGPASTEPTAVFGADLAKSHDWTVVIGLDADGRWTEFHRFQRLWSETRESIARIVGNTPTLIDSTGVGDPIVEELQQTLPSLDGFKFSQTSKQDLMRALQSAVQRRAVTIPDGDCASEMRTFQYEYRAGGHVRYEAPSGYHDDCVCALALAVRALGTMQVAPPQLITVSRRSTPLDSFMRGDRVRGSYYAR